MMTTFKVNSHKDLSSYIYNETKYFESDETLSMVALKAENSKLKNKQEALVKLLR